MNYCCKYFNVDVVREIIAKERNFISREERNYAQTIMAVLKITKKKRFPSVLKQIDKIVLTGLQLDCITIYNYYSLQSELNFYFTRYYYQCIHSNYRSYNHYSNIFYLIKNIEIFFATNIISIVQIVVLENCPFIHFLQSFLFRCVVLLFNINTIYYSLLS